MKIFLQGLLDYKHLIVCFKFKYLYIPQCQTEIKEKIHCNKRNQNANTEQCLISLIVSWVLVL